MLSVAQIKSLKIGDKKRHTDRDGLVLELRPGKKKLNKVFIFRFQWDKKPQTITIGKFPSIELGDARDIAKAYRDLVDRGIDPRVKSSEAEVEQIIFKTIAEQWFQKYKGSWKEVALKRHRKSLTRDIYPFIADKPIDEITKADLLSIIQQHEERGHHDVAHRIFARLKAIFEFAVGSSLTNNYPFIGLHKALIPRPKTIHQPSIGSHDAHDMLAIIRNTNATPITKIYIELLAHLFTRPSELRLARWEEINFQAAEWNIPADRMKMGLIHWVPLSSTVLKLLRELRLATGFTPYLFNSPTLKKPKPISETSIRKLLHNAGFKNRHTAHGFRSLASSVLHEQTSFRTDAIEAQLAHKIQGVRGIYMRADFKKERRQLMEWYSEWLVAKESNINLLLNQK